VVTCEIKQKQNTETILKRFGIVLGLFLFYFTCNYVWNITETKLFYFSFISDVIVASCGFLMSTNETRLLERSVTEAVTEAENIPLVDSLGPVFK